MFPSQIEIAQHDFFLLFVGGGNAFYASFIVLVSPPNAQHPLLGLEMIDLHKNQSLCLLLIGIMKANAASSDTIVMMSMQTLGILSGGR